MQTSSCRRAMLGAAIACATLAGASTPAHAATPSSPVLSPKPGARIAKAPVRIDVRAGREVGDLEATLNGVAIGRDFDRVHRSLRRLTISHSHGLRHGSNVLRVTARSGSATRRATVRFTFAGRRTLVGAGRDLRAAVGVEVELRGSARKHPSRARGAVRWTLVSKPRGSRLRTGRRAGASANARTAALTETSSLTPAFTPDALGTYTVQVTAGTGADAVSDTVEVSSVPRSAFIPLDTAIDGPDPAGTVSTGSQADAARRSGIRVGGTIYRAPWMRKSGTGEGSFSGAAEDSTIYEAGMQVLSLDRSTLGDPINRTYGWCRPPGGGGEGYICRSSSEGRLLRADMATELELFGTDRLVIAATHPNRSNRSTWWLDLAGTPGWTILGELGAVGLPAGLPQGLGELALVGVPTMARGEAQYRYNRGGRARMNGYLSADEALNYGFVPAARPLFDTRAASRCDVAAPCEVTHTVGGRSTSGQLEQGETGYLLTAYNQQDLTPTWTATYETGSANAQLARGAASRLANDLGLVRQQRALVVLSSLVTASGVTAGRQITREEWREVADGIAELGGTRDRFNTAASTPGTDYTLIAHPGLEEGQGNEAIGTGARLRGALVPSRASEFRPLNVSADGAPAERLQQLLVRPPVDVVPGGITTYERQTGMPGPWPLDGDPGARAALAWLGDKTNLGKHPRTAYWLGGTVLNAANEANTVRDTNYVPDQGFTLDDFTTAKNQLLLELRWVANVRAYMANLSAPYMDTIEESFKKSTKIADELEAELEIAKEEAEMQADWFAFVKGLLSFAGGFEGFIVKEAVKHTVNLILEVSISAMEMGAFGYESKFTGAREKIDENKRVRADKLGEELENEAKESVATLERMGNIIVSDYTKLEEVGSHANCILPTGCKPGFEEYGLNSATVKEAKDMALISLQRTLYSDLVPRSFPVWDTGLSADPDPLRNSNCTGADSMNNPFYHDAPRLAWTTSLDDLDPSNESSRWRVFIMTHHEGTTYSWPSEGVLHRMFDPVNPLTTDQGGLGLSPRDVMRDAESRYVPTLVECGWDK